MVIKIDEIRTESIDFIHDALKEYILAIKDGMFTKDELVNPYNVIEQAGLDNDINEIIEDDNRIINSYIDNVLVSLETSLMNFKKFKEKNNKID